MPFDASLVGALVDEIGRYHITDRTMTRAHQQFAARLKDGTASDADLAAYLGAVKRYFAGFEREARAHLSDVDTRLAKAAQIQFNLTAERGVAARRVAATQGVLEKVAELVSR